VKRAWLVAAHSRLFTYSGHQAVLNEHRLGRYDARW